jgi:hypothetical protein
MAWILLNVRDLVLKKCEGSIFFAVLMVFFVVDENGFRMNMC